MFVIGKVRKKRANIFIKIAMNYSDLHAVANTWI